MKPTKAALLPLIIIALSCASSEPDTTTPPVVPPVVPPVTPPPPNPAILFDEGFEDNSFAARGWYDGSPMTATTTQFKTGARALEMHYLPGAISPTWFISRRLFAPSESVYLRYWVKYSANWQGSGQAYHPHEFYFITNEDPAYVGPSRTHLTLYVEHNYQNGGVPALAMQDGMNIDATKIGVNLTGITENRSANGCNGNADGYPTDCYLSGGLYQNTKTWRPNQPWFLANTGVGYKGDWNLVEAYFQLNTIVGGVGQTNGVVQYWFNGQSVINLSNVLFRTGAHPTMKFNQLIIGPYIGDGSPVDQTTWVDDLRIATARTP